MCVSGRVTSTAWWVLSFCLAVLSRLRNPSLAQDHFQNPVYLMWFSIRSGFVWNYRTDVGPRWSLLTRLKACHRGPIGVGTRNPSLHLETKGNHCFLMSLTVMRTTERSWFERRRGVAEGSGCIFLHLHHNSNLICLSAYVSVLLVISMRCMVQFIGREVKYRWMAAALNEECGHEWEARVLESGMPDVPTQWGLWWPRRFGRLKSESCG